MQGLEASDDEGREWEGEGEEEEERPLVLTEEAPVWGSGGLDEGREGWGGEESENESDETVGRRRPTRRR